MKFARLLFMIFILTPLALVQNLAALAFASGMGWVDGAPEDKKIGYIIGGVIVVLISNRIIDFARYGLAGAFEIQNVLFWFIDIPLSMVRLPLQLISDVLGIVALFTDLEMAPRGEATLEVNGFFNCALRHFLQIDADNSNFRRKQAEREQREIASNDASEYKWQNVRFQFWLWVKTMLHGGAFIIWVAYTAYEHSWSYINEPGWDVIAMFATFAVLILLYVILCVRTAAEKGINGVGEYYENERITKVTFEESFWTNDIVAREKVIQEEGWKSYFTFPMIIYFIFGTAMFIPQTVALIIAIAVPPYSAILPLRNTDVNYDNLEFLDKITLFLFGFVRNIY